MTLFAWLPSKNNEHHLNKLRSWKKEVDKQYTFPTINQKIYSIQGFSILIEIVNR